MPESNLENQADTADKGSAEAIKETIFAGLTMPDFEITPEMGKALSEMDAMGPELTDKKLAEYVSKLSETERNLLKDQAANFLG